MQGRITQRTAVEEVHTVLEHLLRRSLGRDAKALSFDGMVDAAARKGYVRTEHVEDVKKLKVVRRAAKHRGQGYNKHETDRLLSAAIPVIHKLLVHISERRDRATIAKGSGAGHELGVVEIRGGGIAATSVGISA